MPHGFLILISGYSWSKINNAARSGGDNLAVLGIAIHLCRDQRRLPRQTIAHANENGCRVPCLQVVTKYEYLPRENLQWLHALKVCVRGEFLMAGLVEPGALSGVWPDGSRGHA